MRISGVLDKDIQNTTFAVIDFETTGLTPGTDRVVEVSIIRLDPDGASTTVLDTLVNPDRRMAATEIHGITDADVADAPRFGDIVDDFVGAIAGCMVASYNIYFDIKFLQYELARAGVDAVPPHLCVMYLRPMLGLGDRCRLVEACRQHGIDHADAHTALADTRAACDLLSLCLSTIRDKRIRRFEDLARLKSYKFLKSFGNAPLESAGAGGGADERRAHKSRNLAKGDPSLAPSEPARILQEKEESDRAAMHAYWDALKTVLCDLRVTDDEVAHLLQTKRELGLKDEQTRVLHARAFISVLTQFSADQWLDDKECRKLRKLRSCLSKAGWAPGD